MGEWGVSLENQLAAMATDWQAEQLQLQLSVAVLKSIQDQQETQAQALIKMIRQSPSPDAAVGTLIDVSA